MLGGLVDAGGDGRGDVPAAPRLPGDAACRIAIPSVLANIAATIDVISGGRLIIGLGAGWNQDESDALGIRLPPLKERFDRFEEGVQVIVKLLSEDRASFEGRHFTLTRGVVRTEAGATSASADRHRRQRGAAHAAHRRRARPALELDALRRCRLEGQV